MCQIQVHLVVDNGGGEIVANYTPADNNSLCDGNWHSITASKSGTTISLEVDNNPSVDVLISDEYVLYLSVDTGTPLFIAGVSGEMYTISSTKLLISKRLLHTNLFSSFPPLPSPVFHQMILNCSDFPPLFTDEVALQLKPTVTNDPLTGCFGTIRVTESGELVTLSFEESSGSANMELYLCKP